MEKLKKRYYGCIRGEFRAYLILLVIFAVRSIAKGDIELTDLLGYLVILAIFAAFSAYRLRPLLKDLPDVRENRCERVTGMIMRLEGNHSKHTTWYPIIRDDATLERIKLKLDVSEIEVEKTYTVLYLKHSKLAVVEKEHTNGVLSE